MGNGTFRLFPSSDREQTVRFRHYLIAAVSSLMVVGLLGICVLAGVLSRRPFFIAAGIVLVSLIAFYVVFRSGLNRRADDASLTVPMMVVAIGVVTYTLYHLGALRTVFLLVYPMIMFFGVLRLDTRVPSLVPYFFVLRLLAAGYPPPPAGCHLHDVCVCTRHLVAGPAPGATRSDQ